MKMQSEQRIQKMRNGEKIKCPKCEKGFISAVGDPKTTRTFSCNHCQTSVVLTVPYSKNNN